MRLVLAFCAALAMLGCAASGSTAVGIVTDIDSGGLGKVRGFTLRTAAGESLTFEVGTVALGGGAFPPDHLREHMAMAEGIEVTYRTENGRLIAIRLIDAPPAPP